MHIDEALRAARVLVRRGVVDLTSPVQTVGAMRAIRRYGAFGGLATHAARRYGHAPALTDDDGSLSFRELDAASNGTARALVDRGIGPSSTIGLLARGHRGLLLTMMAANKIGALTVLLNTGFAAGILREPRLPDIDGLPQFDGPVMHSARWDHTVDLKNKRVAVIGTGSTGVQLVCGLAGTVGRLDLFQRSAQWVVPLPNPSYARWTGGLRAALPALDQMAYRTYHHAFGFFAKALVAPGWRRTSIGSLARANLRTVSDPGLRARLTPDYQPMCRRLVISAGFYRAMQRLNVNLVDDAIDHVDPGGIVTADGRTHDVDAIVLATGFDAHAFIRPMAVTGPEGGTVDELWVNGPVAHLGVALPGFPDFFMLMGPHSPVGNYSLTAVAQVQADHVCRWIQRWGDDEFDTVAPSRPATDAFNAAMHAAMPGTVWATGCTSWYLGADGVPELWPWTSDAYRRRLAETPDPAHYDIDAAPRREVLA